MLDSMKDWLRLSGVPRVSSTANRLGVPWKTLGTKLGRETLIAQAEDLRVPPPEEVEAGQALDVVFATFQGHNHHVVTMDGLIAHVLRSRGHRVRFVLCDGVLPLCQTKHAGDEDLWERKCHHCFQFAKRFLENAGFEVLRFSELVDEIPSPSDDWEHYVESSLLKHFRVGTLPDDPEVARRRAMFRQTAAWSSATGRRIAEMEPDRVVMSHGLYCTWGPAREELLEAGIPVVTTGGGKKRDTVTFNWNLSNDTWDVSTEWERVAEEPLTDEQESALDAYLASRRSHDEDVRIYNFGDEESRERTLERLSLDPDKPTFTLFTNVLWDAASAQREVAFSDPIEWTTETIRWFADHPELQLVVKIHPAEVVIGTRQPFAAEIAARVDEVPSNVRVIEPQEEVNSWSILRITDVGLVHTSTVGLELALEGVPCVVVSRTHFRGKGFTIDVDDRGEYFRSIERWDDLPWDPDRARTLARRYAFLMFERYQIPFPFTHQNGTFDPRALRVVDPESLMAHAGMRAIVKGLEDRRELLLPA